LNLLRRGSPSFPTSAYSDPTYLQCTLALDGRPGVTNFEVTLNEANTAGDIIPETGAAERNLPAIFTDNRTRNQASAASFESRDAAAWQTGALFSRGGNVALSLNLRGPQCARTVLCPLVARILRGCQLKCWHSPQRVDFPARGS
jgi:hypothetical protein